MRLTFISLADPLLMLGGTTESDQPSGSGSSDETGYAPRKRAKKNVPGGGRFDLNLPADVVDRN